MAGDYAAADEILQEIFYKAFTGIRSYREGDFRGWLYKIAYNTSLDYLKSESRRSGREQKSGNEWFRTEYENLNVESVVIGREEAREVRDALCSLPENQRAAISLFAVGEFSIREIAAVMNCAEGTVMSHLHRARQALCKLLSK